MTGARVVALGHYQPVRVVTNDELSQTVDTNDEWIRDRVGVVTRRIAADDETVADMAVAAGGKAIANSGLTPADIDLVIVATCTAETSLPNVSAQVASRLQIPAPGAFDLNTACSGFSYGLANAQHAIVAGASKNVLVIGVEKLSAWLDWTDRATCIIFGDGAGAAVVSASETSGIGPVLWGSDGDKAQAIRVETRDGFLKQDGQTVFRWATTALAPLALEVCAKAGVRPEDLAAVIPHQANTRIIDSLARKIGAANAVVARDIVESGNTSAASIPLALSKMVERGEVPSGAPVLLFGFGGGLTYAGQVITCP